jgi:DNA-binding MarR family transcriptional regulator
MTDDANMATRPPSIALVDEIGRLNGRFKTLFADVRRGVGLGDTELLVMSAVVEARRPPTVPQIGRSLGHPRQIIQRAANALIAAGLVEHAPNPDHKRAALLLATSDGIARKRQADALAVTVTADLADGLDPMIMETVAGALAVIRLHIEERVRARARR